MSTGRICSLNADDGRLIDEISVIDAELFPGNIWGRDAYAKSAANDYDCLLAFVEEDEASSALPLQTGAYVADAGRSTTENAHAAGFAQLRCFDDAELIRIAVAADHRRLGIGRRLLDALIAEARKRGTGSIFLEVRRGNTAAIKLYEGAGFEHIGVRKDYYHAPKEDALIMRYTC